MKLELLKVSVKGVKWGGNADAEKTGPSGKQKTFWPLTNDSSKSIQCGIHRSSGESVRIVPVKDVIEPRYKVEGSGQVFPGMVSDVESVGEGKTLVLEGAAVVTCGRIVGFQEGIIDMSEKGCRLHAFFQNMQCGSGF